MKFFLFLNLNSADTASLFLYFSSFFYGIALLIILLVFFELNLIYSKALERSLFLNTLKIRNLSVVSHYTFLAIGAFLALAIFIFGFNYLNFPKFIGHLDLKLCFFFISVFLGFYVFLKKTLNLIEYDCDDKIISLMFIGIKYLFLVALIFSVFFLPGLDFLSEILKKKDANLHFDLTLLNQRVDPAFFLIFFYFLGHILNTFSLIYIYQGLLLFFTPYKIKEEDHHLCTLPVLRENTRNILIQTKKSNLNIYWLITVFCLYVYTYLRASRKGKLVFVYSVFLFMFGVKALFIYYWLSYMFTYIIQCLARAIENIRWRNMFLGLFGSQSIKILGFNTFLTKAYKTFILFGYDVIRNNAGSRE